MLFNLFPIKQFLQIGDKTKDLLPLVFPVESMVGDLVFSSELDSAGAQAEIKGLAFTCILLDHDQYGNHHFWDTNVTKEEKLKRLFDMHMAFYPDTKSKLVWTLINQELNDLGIKSVRIKRIQPRINRYSITVVVDLDVMSQPQAEQNKKTRQALADGTKPGDIAVASATARTKGAKQVKHDEGYFAWAEVWATKTAATIDGFLKSKTG